MKHLVRAFLGALFVLAAASSSIAQDRVVTAGQDGVAAPKRTKTVNPVYPQEALAQGTRGIVILEILIDPQGKVASAQVIRSIAGLDEAALEAVRKWEYEVTKVGGQPVSVKLTVPITFAMKVPEVTRAPGIPELRQGAIIQYPAGQTDAQTVTAEVTLDPGGQVAEAEVVKGDAPFSIALLTALRTWRFAPEGEGVLLSFRVEADFVPARGERPRVDVRLTGLRRSEAAPRAAAVAPEPPASAVETPAPPAPVAAAPVVPAPVPANPVPPAPASQPPATSGPVTQPPVTQAPAPVAATPTSPASVAPASPSAPAPLPAAPPSTTPPAVGPPAPTPSRPGAPTVAEAKPAPPAPPVEVVTAPRPQAEAPRPVEPGVSAIKDVSLALGVPDLVRGRRPVPPPLARMAGTTGTVEVKFGVDAAGAASVKEASGPEVLTAAATYTVHSWLFRRVTAERLHLVAVFDFAGETAKASVKPE